MTKQGLAAVLLALLWAGCSGHEIELSDVEGPFTWGGVENVTHLKHLWFSGQPDDAALQQAREHGVVAVINLRDPAEFDWDEAGAVEALGMSYYSVPVRGDAPFEREAFARIYEIVREHDDGQVLVHCSSSNRVGAWLAAHMVDDHGQSFEQGLAFGRRAGLTKEPLVEKLRDYLAVSPD
jgi:protein tyrosine phosphatase (PTP) superfamily phosphohydrolase (DUF442 family)